MNRTVFGSCSDSLSEREEDTYAISIGENNGFVFTVNSFVRILDPRTGREIVGMTVEVRV